MLAKLTEILVDKLDVDASTITAETSFKDDLEVDSLDLFDLVMSLEEEFGISIPSEELENITTVGAMVDYLTSKGDN